MVLEGEMINTKVFSEREKEYIKQELIKNGRELFSRYGIKKTSIEQITKSTRIAKGSFYSFFDSKEDLYFYILMEEIKISVESNHSLSFTDDSPRQIVREVLSDAVRSMDTNPILNKMLIQEEYELVYRKIGLAEDNKPMDIIAPLTGLFSKWQSEGVIIDQKPEFLANVVKCLFLLTTHKKEIGEGYFDGIMEFLIDVISEKITINPVL